MKYDGRNYQELDAKLQGRCRESRKIGNHTYAQRRNRYSKEGVIAILLHNTDILSFYPNGDIKVNTGGWHTVTTRSCINEFLPRPYTVSGYGRDRTMLYNGNGWDNPLSAVDDSVLIKADGTTEGGGNAQDVIAEVKREKLEAARPRNRARYWINKVREGKPSPKLTVAKILEEENQTVRLAMMRVFGFDRFILEANAKVIDEKAGYELLELPMDRWSNLRALKMKCSTTGAVYINQVPPHCHEVPSALDWMFDTKDYLGQITQQT
jgi:hypothetical protein